MDKSIISACDRTTETNSQSKNDFRREIATVDSWINIFVLVGVRLNTICTGIHLRPIFKTEIYSAITAATNRTRFAIKIYRTQLRVRIASRVPYERQTRRNAHKRKWPTEWLITCITTSATVHSILHSCARMYFIYAKSSISFARSATHAWWQNYVDLHSIMKY